jgi:putative endonuclease
MNEPLSITQTLSPRAQLGHEGERLAANFLEQNGYRIVLANFKVPVGRNSRSTPVTGEIDIVALDEAILCFIEVKARRSETFTPAITAVDLRKQRQITRTAKVYRRIFGVYDMPYRFDVVTVITPESKTPVIEITKAFWNEAKFRKRSWNFEMWRESF